MSFSRLLAAGRSMVGMKNSQSPYRMRAENLLPKFESTKNPFAPVPKTEAPKPQPVKSIPLAPPIPAMAKAGPLEALFGTQLSLVSTIPVATEELSEPESVRIVIKEPELAIAASQTAVAESAIQMPAQKLQPILRQRRVMQPEANKGLVDASPLGLKTGTPTRAPLPAPVVAKNPAKQPAPAEPPATSPEKGTSCVVAEKPVKSEPKISWFARLAKLVLPGKRPQPVNERKAVQTELSLDRIKVVRNDLSDADLEVVTIRRSEKQGNPAMRLQPLAEAETGNLGRIASRIFGASQSLVR